MRLSLLGLLMACGCAARMRAPETNARRIAAVADEWYAIESDSATLKERATHVRKFVWRHGALLPFWPADSLSEKTRAAMRIVEHPCGESTVALVHTIPMRHPRLGIEWMYEFDGSGAIVGRWPVPSDRMPVALRGDELLVTGPARDILLAIRPDGTFRFRTDRVVEDHEAFECPKLQVLSDSDYAECATFIDDGKRRNLAYESVCT